MVIYLKKILKIILKTSRIILAIIVIMVSLITISFAVINYKLSYDIPQVVNIELYDNQNNKYLSYTNGRKQNYVKIDNISPNIINAFLSIEDKRFYQHQGIDIVRIFGAILSDIKAGSFKEGASTITQQYVRALYLDNNKTIKRKLSELLIAMNIESKYSKNEILEGYLNTIYFDHGIYGIEDASIYYFGKKSSELTISEAAILAAIPKGPSIYSPIKNLENNTERKNLILQELLNDQIITFEQFNIALNDKPNIIGINPHTEDEAAPYFQDMVIKEVLQMNFIGDYLYKGIKVYTTLDTELNNSLLKYIKKYHPNSDIEIACYAIEPKTGAVLSVIGGTNYKTSSFNRATNSKRQPGSTIKPFLYLTALENGFNLATTFKSEKTTFYVNNEAYSPHNYKSIYPNQDVSMIYALATSDNIYAMKTHLFLGEEKLADKLKSFGVSGNIPAIPSLALGTYEMTLQELTNAYQILANNGVQQDSYFISKITTIDDEPLYERKNTSGKRLADETDVYLLNEAMTKVFDPKVSINILPTCARISSLISHKLSAKTGSTDTDNLIVGYNENILLSIWTGYDDNQKINSSEDTSFGKQIWARTIDKYLDSKNDNSWYKTPENVVKVLMNPITGFYSSINGYTDNVYFRKNNIPWFIELLYKKEE